MGSCPFWILVFKELLMGSWKLLFIVNQLILINICHLTHINREAIKSPGAENLTSNNNGRENERQYVTNVLKENNYPKSFLHG